MDVVDRMFSLIELKFPEQKDFASAINVHPTRISEWKKRKSKSYNKYLPQIAEVLGTTTEYLLTGKAELPPFQHEETTAAKDGGLLEEFGRIFDSLTPENQNAVIAEMLRRLRNQ